MEEKQFIKLMSELLSLKADEDKLNEAFKKLEPDFNYISFGRHEGLIVDLLEIAMNDKSEWISYWLYDLDCGKNAEKDSIQENNKSIPIKTINDLYNLLTK